ncbi:nucleotide exchange factor GrpE [Candidatus Peregrinibacteria bacterium]|nr:nucleotide exchange factor GrpE [Candidatus Peregrinibacteria bacterium]
MTKSQSQSSTHGSAPHPNPLPKGEGKHPPQHAAVNPPVDIAQLRAEIEKLRAEVQTFKELAARAQADLQNARARMGKEAEEMRIFAAELLIRQLLPTIDSLRRACQHLPVDLQSHEWVKGILSTEQEFLRQFKSIGCEPIDAIGKPFDPLQHEVLFAVPGEEGKVLEVLEEGYLFRGKVLRPAKVKVGQGTVAPDSPAH